MDKRLTVAIHGVPVDKQVDGGREDTRHDRYKTETITYGDFS